MKEASNSKALTDLMQKEPRESLKQNFKSNNNDKQNNTINLKQIEGIGKLSIDGAEQTPSNEDKAILLVGHPYCGKTTLGHLLSKKPLKASFNEEWGQEILEAMHDFNEPPLIGDLNDLLHQSSTIPNKFVDSKSGIVIWDCPSFHDRELHPEQASFDYKKLCLQYKQVKIVLVYSWAFIKDQRGSAFVSSLTQFSDNFQNIEIEQVKDSIFLVVSKTNARHQTFHLKNTMLSILEGYDEILKPQEKEIIKHFGISDNIFLFPAPTKVEENFKSSLSLSDIDSAGQYLDFNELELLGNVDIN